MSVAHRQLGPVFVVLAPIEGVMIGDAMQESGKEDRRMERMEDPDRLGQRLDELVRRLAARKRVPHAIVRVEHGDGFRWTGAVGDARPGGPPIRADMPFFIASVTKLYIATVVMKLHEGGQVRLGDPITTYLSGELTKGLHRLGGVDRTEEITLRHLLGHASGLPDYLEERPRGGRSLLERVVEEGDTAWDIPDIVRIVRGLRPHFPPQPLQEGRHRIRYSDTNYLLLIAVIEAVTGRRQHEAFEHLLFRPLHLGHTWLPGHSEPLDPTGDPATVWYRDRPLHIPQAMSSFRDLYSTLDDTIAFLRALVRGEVFEDPATLDLMTSRWMRFGFPRDMAALRAPGWPIRYGLGMMRFRFRIPRVRTPDGEVPELIGHSGSTGSWLFWCPQLDLFLSGTVDQATAGPLPFRFLPRLLRLVGRAAA